VNSVSERLQRNEKNSNHFITETCLLYYPAGKDNIRWVLEGDCEHWGFVWRVVELSSGLNVDLLGKGMWRIRGPAEAKSLMPGGSVWPRHWRLCRPVTISRIWFILFR
jgi:hypothetical protein